MTRWVAIACGEGGSQLLWTPESTSTTLQYFWFILKCGTKQTCCGYLGVFWDRSQWASIRVGTEFHSQQDQVSWPRQPHALDSSSVTLGFGEFDISLKNSSSLSMLWKERENNNVFFVLFFLQLWLKTIWSKCGRCDFIELVLTVRFWIPSEKAPICLTVPSESSICETGHKGEEL